MRKNPGRKEMRKAARMARKKKGDRGRKSQQKMRSEMGQRKNE